MSDIYMPRSGGGVSAGVVAAILAAATRGRKPMYAPGNPAGRKLWKKNRKGARAAQRRRKNRKVLAPTPVRHYGGPESQSKFYLSHRPSRQAIAMKRVGAPNILVNNESWQQTAPSGTQANSAFSYNNRVDLQEIQDKLPASATKYGRYLLESSHNELLITNNSQATAIVDIYDVVRRRDANRDVSGNMPSENPNKAWSYGWEVQGAQDHSDILNSLPTDSQFLKTYFKIVNRRHLAITQGGVHRHTTMLKTNKLVDSMLLNEADGDLTGLAVYTMVVFYGQPASAVEGSPGLVSTAPITLNFVVSRRYKYTWTADTSYNLYTEPTVPTTITVKGLNIGTGEFEDYDVV